MAYYEVSVLITILATSLIAFYLLYKSKELNLGILISISIGSIVLGFTFGPAFNKMLDVLNDSLNINKNLVLILSILAVLFIFLLFILIISIIISISIPKKIASIDCCLIIERLKSSIKIRESIDNIRHKLTETTKKIISHIHKLVGAVYNLKNKLKKPVDTTQIIDTMGIEKNDIVEIEKHDIDTIITEVDETEVIEANSINELDINLHVEIEQNDLNTYNDLANEEVAASDEVDIFMEPAVENNVEGIEEIKEEEIVEDVRIDEIQVEEMQKEEVVQELEDDIMEDEINENIYIDNQLYDVFENDATDHIDYDAVEFVLNENSAIIEETDSDEHAILMDAESLVLKAFDCKDEGRKVEAVEYYFRALEHKPDNDMIFWIVLDICTLYKQLGLSELASSILEGLVNDYGSIIQPEIKEEILNNLSQN